MPSRMKGKTLANFLVDVANQLNEIGEYDNHPLHMREQDRRRALWAADKDEAELRKIERKMFQREIKQ